VKIAYIWYKPVEKAMIERLFQMDRPLWGLECIHESQVTDLFSAINLLKLDFAAIMLHLSTPPCLALKLAELVHKNRLPTRVVLISHTPADPEAIQRLFGGHVHPDRDITRVTELLDKLLHAPFPHIETDAAVEDAIVRILNTDHVFQYQFRLHFPVLYRSPFAVDDYYRFAEACLHAAESEGGAVPPRRVFISHASKDEALALDLCERLQARKVPSFAAARDLEGGTPWQEDIRQALRSCAEVLILLTPNSIDRPWIMIEAGAAWVLGKRVTPCLAYVEPGALPEPLTVHQGRSLVTSEEIDKIVDEVAQRHQGT
jgi:hypothetical protein